MGLKIVLDTKDAVKAAKDFAEAVGRVQLAVAGAGRSADFFQKATDRMARRFGAVGKASAKTAESVERFSAALRSTPRIAEQASRSMGRLGKTSRTTGNQLQNLARQILGVAAARKAVSTISDLESGLVTLGTVTGKTGSDLEALKNVAVDVAQGTRFTPEETVGALLDLSRAGQDAATAAASLVSVTQLAQAGVTTLGQAANLTAATLAQFKTQGVDAATAASTLVATADRTKSTVLSLGSSLAQAGQAAATFDVSLAEAAATVGVLQDSGIPASRAGRALKTILANLASAGERSESSRKSLELLGLQIGDVIPNKSKKFTDVLRSIRDGLDGIGGEQRTNIFRNLVGKDFFGVLTSAIEGIEKIDEVSEIAANSIGELESKADRQNQTLAASIRGVSSAFQEVLIDAEEARGGLKDIFDAFADGVRVLGGVQDNFRDAAKGSQAFAVGLKGVGFAAAAAVPTLITLTGPIGAIAVGLAAVATAANEVGLALVGYDSRQQATLRSAINFSDSVEGSREKIRGLQREIGVAFRTGDQEAEKLVQRLDDQLASALRTVSNSSGEFTNELGAALGVLTKFQAIERDFGSSTVSSFQKLLGEDSLSELEEIGNAADRLSRLRIAQANLLNTLQEGAKGELRDAERLNRERRQFNSLVEGSVDAESKYVEQRRQVLDLTREAIGAEVEKAQRIQTAVNAAKKLAEEEREAQAAGQKRIEIETEAQRNAKERLASARADLAISTTRSTLEDQIRDSSAEKASTARRLVDLIAEQQRRAEGVALSDEESLAAIREAAELEVQALRISKEAAFAAQRRKDEEREIVKAKREALRAERELQEVIASRRSTQSARRAVFRDIRSLEERVSIDRSGGTSNILTNQALFDQVLAESIATLRASGIEQGEAIKLASQRLELEREVLLVAQERAEGEKSSAAARDRAVARDQIRGAFADQQLRLDSGRLQGSGDRVGSDTLESRRAAGSLRFGSTGTIGFGINEGLRSAFFAREEQIKEEERLADRQRELQSQIGNGLRSFYNTLIQSNGDIREALGALAQSFVQSLANKAIESAASGIASIFFQRGGVIPAQTGRIIDTPTTILAGGKNYSVAEGGGSTPEAVFPLQRDSQGRLGIAGAGGGGNNITVVMPNVRDSRTAREARRNVRDGIRGILSSVDNKSRGMRPGRNR